MCDKEKNNKNIDENSSSIHEVIRWRLEFFEDTTWKKWMTFEDGVFESIEDAEIRYNEILNEGDKIRIIEERVIKST
jgi:hypothetical protein